MRTEEGLLLFTSPVDGADLASGSPDTKPAGDQDAAADHRAKVSHSVFTSNTDGPLHTGGGGWGRAGTYSALQSFCQASWYLTGSS